MMKDEIGFNIGETDTAPSTDAESCPMHGPEHKEHKSKLKAAHRVEHEADVLHLVMKPKIWKEDFLTDSEHDEHRKVSWSEVAAR